MNCLTHLVLMDQKRDYKLSRAELIKHDVIMFLVDDSDTFDNRLVAEEIVNIIESEKPLILVMNNKQTVDGEDDEEGAAKRAKLYHNIQTVSAERGIHNVAEKFSFIMVDAETAFNARMQGKNLLLKESRLEDLELLILQKLKERDGFKFLLPPISMITQQLNTLQLMLQQQLSSQEEKEIIELIDDLRDRRSLLLNTLKTRVKLKLESAKVTVFNKLSNNESADADLAKLNSEIEQLLNNEINATMTDVTNDVTKFFIKVRSNINITPVKVGDAGQVTVPTFESQDTASSTFDLAKETASNIIKNQAVIKGAETVLTKTLAKTVLPKIVAAPIPIVNILLTVSTIFEVISMFSKRKEQREQEERRIQEQAAAANAQQAEMANRRVQAIQQLRTQLDVEFFRMGEDILKEVDKNVQNSFDEYIANIQQELQMKQEEKSIVTSTLEHIEKLKNDANYVKVQIS